MPRVLPTRDISMLTMSLVHVAVVGIIVTDVMLAWRDGWARSMVESFWMDLGVCWRLWLMMCASEAVTVIRVTIY